MEYEVYFKPSAFLDAARLPLAAWKDIKHHIDQLSKKPSNNHSKKILKQEYFYYEAGIKPYYIVYKVSVVEKLLTIIKIAKIKED